MNSLTLNIDMPKPSLQQSIKWIVYSLLLINFALYFQTDLQVAKHTMRHGGSILEWSRAFSTTINLSAWVLLLALFELETYMLSYDPLSRPKIFLINSLKIICYLSLLHTLYSLGVYFYEVNTATPVKDVTSLCQLLGKDISYMSNLVYTEINANNCSTLSKVTEFVYLDPPRFLIVTDTEALVIAYQLAWVDIVESTSWLLLLFIYEGQVVLQDRSITSGRLFKSLNIFKILFYSIIWTVIVYWIYRGHYMFAWDEFMWVAGFFVISMNMDEWKDEIIAKKQPVNTKLNRA